MSLARQDFISCQQASVLNFCYIIFTDSHPFNEMFVVSGKALVTVISLLLTFCYTAASKEYLTRIQISFMRLYKVRAAVCAEECGVWRRCPPKRGTWEGGYICFKMACFDALLHIFVCPMLCNAWIEYKFTCVCVCVCVCVHFKPNMRKIQIAISSDLCNRLT